MPESVNLGHYAQRAQGAGNFRITLKEDAAGEKLGKTSSRFVDLLRRTFRGKARREENVRTVRRFKDEVLSRYGPAGGRRDAIARLDKLIAEGKSLRAGTVREILAGLDAGATRAPTRCGRLFSAVSGEKPDMVAFAGELSTMSAALQKNQDGSVVSSAEVRNKAMTMFRNELAGLSPGALMQVYNGMNKPEFRDTKEGLHRRVDQEFGQVPTRDALGMQTHRSVGDVRDMWDHFGTAVLDEMQERGMPAPDMPPPPTSRMEIPAANGRAIDQVMERGRANGAELLRSMSAGVVRGAAGDGDALTACGAHFRGLREATGFGREDENRATGFEATYKGMMQGEIRRMMREDPGAAAKLAMFSSGLKNNPQMAGRLASLKNPPPPPPGLAGRELEQYQRRMASDRTAGLDIEFLAACIDEELETGAGMMLAEIQLSPFTESDVEVSRIPVDPSHPDVKVDGADADFLRTRFSHQFLRDIIRHPLEFEGAPLTADAESLRRFRDRLVDLHHGDRDMADQQLRNLTPALSQSLERGFLDIAVREGKIPICSANPGPPLERKIAINPLPDGSFQVTTTLRRHINGYSSTGDGAVFLDASRSIQESTASYIIRAGTEDDGQRGVVLLSAAVTITAFPGDAGADAKPTVFRATHP